jgi:hypothetical protein
MPEGAVDVLSHLSLISRAGSLARLPDQLDIKFGPVEALGRFILRADRTLRDAGIRLSLCSDFDELLDTNQRKRDRGWYSLPPCFLAKYSTLNERNALWLKGVGRSGETVLSHAIRLYVWPRTTLKAEIESLRLLYDVMPYAPEARGEATAPTAAKMSGRVCMMGALWLDPDFRGGKLASTISPLTRAVALSQWYPDFCFSIVSDEGMQKGRTALYGWPAQNVERAIKFWNLPGYSGPAPHGGLCFLSRDEIEKIVIAAAPEPHTNMPARDVAMHQHHGAFQASPAG